MKSFRQRFEIFGGDLRLKYMENGLDRWLWSGGHQTHHVHVWSIVVGYGWSENMCKSFFFTSTLDR